MYIIVDSSKLTNEFETESITGVQFLEVFTRLADIPKSVILDTIPLLALDHYQAKIIK